jgi:hypothetical protein
MSQGSASRQGDRTQYFGKFPHLLWDLGLVQRFLTERQDLLGLLAMLRYADFTTGECTVFASRLAREAGVAHPTQVKRIQDKIVRTGAFWRPEGRAGFKKVHGKWVRRYYRSTGKQILEHALRNNLITEEQMRAIQLRLADDETHREAEEAQSGPTDDGYPPEWDDTDDGERSVASG